VSHRALVACASNRDGNYEIYVMSADGTDPVRLTNDPAEDREPAWRPQQGRVAGGGRCLDDPPPLDYR